MGNFGDFISNLGDFISYAGEHLGKIVVAVPKFLIDLKIMITNVINKLPKDLRSIIIALISLIFTYLIASFVLKIFGSLKNSNSGGAE